jgi:hypothetical protein
VYDGLTAEQLTTLVQEAPERSHLSSTESHLHTPSIRFSSWIYSTNPVARSASYPSEIWGIENNLSISNMGLVMIYRNKDELRDALSTGASAQPDPVIIEQMVRSQTRDGGVNIIRKRVIAGQEQEFVRRFYIRWPTYRAPSVCVYGHQFENLDLANGVRRVHYYPYN